MLVKILSCFIKERIKGTKNRIALNVIDNIKVSSINSIYPLVSDSRTL